MGAGDQLRQEPPAGAGQQKRMGQRKLRNQDHIGKRGPRPGHGTQTFAKAKEHREDHRQHASGKERVTDQAHPKRQCNPPGPQWRAQRRPDQRDQPGNTGIGDPHIGTICSRMRGICFFTLKNPAVAWGQIALSQSRRQSHREMPRTAKAGVAWSSQSRSGPWVT